MFTLVSDSALLTRTSAVWSPTLYQIEVDQPVRHMLARVDQDHGARQAGEDAVEIRARPRFEPAYSADRAVADEVARPSCPRRSCKIKGTCIQRPGAFRLLLVKPTRVASYSA